MMNEKHKEFSGDFNERFLNLRMSEIVEAGLLNASSSQRVFETGKPVVLEQVVYPGTEDEKIYLAKSIPYLDENGEIEFVVSYLLDINEKHKLIKELEKAQLNNERYILELRQIRNEMFTTSPIIHRSKAMENINERVNRIARTDATVLIMGETGTGKNLLAKHIHSLSSRSEKSFLTINCGAIPSNLIESELFGYEKGAFSGANSTGKKGIFEYADGGTLLLDEIGEMPLDMQVRLLRVLQESSVTRVGGNKVIPVDVRIIAATNKDLRREVAKGSFRQDVYYRLSVIPVVLPPLRERIGDIPYLMEHFLKEKAQKLQRKIPLVDKKLVDQLVGYHWPGNIRELENIVENIVNFDGGTTFSIDVTDKEMKTGKKKLEEQNNNEVFSLEEVEKKAIGNAIEVLKGNMTKVAKALGISRNTLYCKIKKYGMG